MSLTKYPFLSTIALLLLIYLTFFKPPSLDEPLFFEHLDKLVHFLMYCGVASALWFDYLRTHNNKMNKGYIIAFVFPILLGGVFELFQEYLTTYRGGEWLDFLANTLGVFGALAVARYVLQPLLNKYDFLGSDLKSEK